MAASSKKKAPAAKPVARRFKVAVPERMTIAFETTRATWFNETTNAELRGWKGVRARAGGASVPPLGVYARSHRASRRAASGPTPDRHRAL